MPGKPTAWLTNAQVDYQLQYAVPRPSLAFDAILEIVAAHLPAQAARYGLPQPGAYAYYGSDLSKHASPYIALSSSPTAEEVGVGFHDTHNLVLSCIYVPQVNAIPIRQCVDLLTLVRGILSVPQIAGNYHGPAGDGPLLWVRLLPRGDSFVPPDWPQYSGVVGHWMLQQPPSPEAWD
jgi:hypothetical protein